ncbi:MAG: hypothetical protein M3M84_02675, partial [Thermoproteota archaeon]|nr:hypothetical protein [Thermoproteota archaeon]
DFLEKVTISMKITKLLLRQKLKVKGYLIVTFFLACASEIVKKVIAYRNLFKNQGEKLPVFCRHC